MLSLSDRLSHALPVRCFFAAEPSCADRPDPNLVRPKSSFAWPRPARSSGTPLSALGLSFPTPFEGARQGPLALSPGEARFDSEFDSEHRFAVPMALVLP